LELFQLFLDVVAPAHSKNINSFGILFLWINLASTFIVLVNGFSVWLNNTRSRWHFRYARFNHQFLFGAHLIKDFVITHLTGRECVFKSNFQRAVKIMVQFFQRACVEMLSEKV
jgi:hypothetical protein